MFLRSVLIPAAAWLALGASPAGAVLGGAPSDGPLARGAVMVLSSRGGVCSAVVVAADALLTAAHCASGAGEYRVHWKDGSGPPVLIQPAEIVLHPGYDRGAIAGRRRSVDLALLRMPSRLPPPFTAATLALGPAAAGEPVTVGGYGVTREGDGRSTGTFREVTLSAVEPYGPSRILVWARGPGGAGGCEGDSGGPVARGDGAVLAVTVWAAGKGRAACGDLTQGVLVGPQRAWIDATLRHWSREALWR